MNGNWHIHCIPGDAAGELMRHNRSCSPGLCSSPSSGQAPAPQTLSCPKEPKIEGRFEVQSDRLPCPGTNHGALPSQALTATSRRDSPAAQGSSLPKSKIGGQRAPLLSLAPPGVLGCVQLCPIPIPGIPKAAGSACPCLNLCLWAAADSHPGDRGCKSLALPWKGGVGKSWMEIREEMTIREVINPRHRLQFSLFVPLQAQRCKQCMQKEWTVKVIKWCL